ncbi:MAG: metallophosphoesterase [Proteobacteria bacterium]|nr:metallophosphoesterase [Pseudomonadota bacterium]
MKIQLLSDLHNEFLRNGEKSPGHKWAGSIPDTNADIIILAGDIDTGTKGAEWAISESERLAKNIIYVLGNHEFYGNEYYSLKQKISKRCEGTGVYCLDPDVYIQEGVRFIGTTLWTDYKADISMPQDLIMYYVDKALADHKEIKYKSGNSYRRFKPLDALAIHIKELNWIERQLDSLHEGKTVVVTHHGPHPVCQHPVYPVDEMSTAFHSDLSSLIAKNDIDVWVYGHTHANLDKVIFDTRIISNQAGCPGENISNFNASFTFEL